MGGWKTWTGFVGLVAAAALSGFGYDDAAAVVATPSGGFMVVGVAHKIEKFLGPVVKYLPEAMKAVQFLMAEIEKVKAREGAPKV